MRAISTRIVTNTTPLVVSSQAAMFRHRLLNAARAVVEFDHSQDKVRQGRVWMTYYMKPCGAPACVLGHYALRADLQDAFKVVGSQIAPIDNEHAPVIYDGWRIRDHFGLSYEEANDLFSAGGCGVGNGGDPLEESDFHNRHPGLEPERVAQYIRNFVARKYPQWERAQ